MTDMQTQLWGEYSIGIDPGWTNLGTALVKKTKEPFKFEIIKSGTWKPADNPEGIINAICSYVMQGIDRDAQFKPNLIPLSIERYVNYGDVRSTHTEEITMVIGMLRQEFWRQRGLSGARMHKAIDWKTKLCQTLVRYTGFDNPSKTGALDKKFSIAAAKHLTINHDKIADDHQADAICLAAYPQVLAQANLQKKRDVKQDYGGA